MADGGGWGAPPPEAAGAPLPGSRSDLPDTLADPVAPRVSPSWPPAGPAPWAPLLPRERTTPTTSSSSSSSSRPVHPVEASGAARTGDASTGARPWSSSRHPALFEPWETPFLSRETTEATRKLLPWEMLRDRAMTVLRERALSWVDGLDSAGGTRRSTRIGQCGALEVVWNPVSEQTSYRQNWCRDRACPGCQVRLAAKYRHSLRAFKLKREEEDPDAPMLFATFTQWDAPCSGEGYEDPRDATNRLLARWERFRHRRPVRFLLAGYVRAVEVVFSPRGWRQSTRTGKRFHSAYNSYHAHIHLAIELHPCAVVELDPAGYVARAMEKLQTLWLACAPEGEPADRLGQDARRLTNREVGQICKYITKPFELPEEHAVTFFGTMAGARLMAAGGTWTGALRDEENEFTESAWVPQAKHVGELVEAVEKGDHVIFNWSTVRASIDTGGETPSAAPDLVRRVRTGDHETEGVRVHVLVREAELVVSSVRDKFPLGIEAELAPRGPPG